MELVGAIAYRLKLPPEAKIHPVFHVSQLKKSVAPSATVQPLPSILTADLEMRVTLEVAVKYRKLSNNKYQVLIKWMTLPDCDNAWEDNDVIKSSFLIFSPRTRRFCKEGYC